MRRVTFAFFVAAALAPHTATADDAIAVDARIDVPLTAAAGAAWIASEALKPDLVGDRCRWCDRDGRGRDTLGSLDRGARDTLRWSDPASADLASNFTGFAAAPLISLGGLALAASLAGRGPEAWHDTLVALEATMLAADLNQAVKFVAMRQRPYAHAVAGGLRGPDDNLSFYSGHTSLVFSLATSAGTIASMRHRELAPLVWASGLTAAVVTGWLRIAADKHYLSDVVTGAAVGALIGFAVPYVFHGRRESAGGVAWSLIGVPGGLGVGGAY